MNTTVVNRRFIKRIIADSVICLLIMVNIIIGIRINDSMKPKCIIDGCIKSRVEESYYCSKHTHTDGMERVVYYGKR